VTSYLRNHLGLYDTRTKIPVNQLNRFIQGYKDASRPVQWYDLTSKKTDEINTNLFYPGDPNINSTMADMLKYVIANVQETDLAIRLLHKETYHQTNSTGVGLSWMISNNDRKRFFYHSGRTGIGFSTLCVAYPQDKVRIMILVNDNLSQDNISILSDKIKVAIYYTTGSCFTLMRDSCFEGVIACLSNINPFFFPFFLNLRPYQIKNPVTGKLAPISVAKNASTLPGNPRILPTCIS
jgi:hypothetical protein